MRLSTKGRYAVMAMTDLAKRQDESEGRAVALAEIAGRQQISLSYLEQLFARLRRKGLVISARGPGGGYRLARPAASITVSEIVDAVDEPIRATRCEEGSPGCLGGERCLTHDLWSELGEQIRLFLAHVTLADVVEGRIAGRAVMPRSAALPPIAEAAQ